MPAIVASEINLMPDWTVFVQLGVFVSVVAILHFFIFKPVLKIIDQRKKFTDDSKTMADQLNLESESQDNARKKTMAQAIAEASASRLRQVTKTRNEAEKILANARTEAKRIIDSTEVSVESSEEHVIAQLERQADSLSKDIVAKIIAGA